MPPKQETQPRWQVDRHVNVAMLLAMVVQTVGIVWWAATLTGRVSELEQKVGSIQPVLERAARMETQIEGLKEHVLEVKLLVRNSVMTYMPPPPAPNPPKPALVR